MDSTSTDYSRRINITDKKEVENWCTILNCYEEDLIDAVKTVGSSARIVNDYLILNRKKIK